MQISWSIADTLCYTLTLRWGDVQMSQCEQGRVGHGLNRECSRSSEIPVEQTENTGCMCVCTT